MTRRMRSGAVAGSGRSAAPQAALAVIGFWRSAGPGKWFGKSAAFDRVFRERFVDLHEAAARRALDDWSESAEGALALVILLDQFPRNAFRGSPRMYATDGLARRVARLALDAGHDRLIDDDLSLFLYLPFAHSEDLSDQELSVMLNRRLCASAEAHARGHRDIIRRFGRFPQRNRILGRTTTAAEQAFLEAGGFNG